MGGLCACASYGTLTEACGAVLAGRRGSLRRADLGGAGKRAEAGIGAARAQEGRPSAAVERSGFEKRGMGVSPLARLGNA